MKKYETYKDSGLEWLGMVPEHWEIDKLKYQFGLVTAPSESSNKIGLENIESATGRFIKTDSDFEGDGIAFQPKDIVYGKLRPYLQKVWLAEFSGSAVGDFYVFRCNEGTYPTFMKYMLLSHNFTVEADGSTYGAKMPRVSCEFIGNLKWAMPPLSEQRTIASYLDHKVGKIDTLISEKEKMVEDLKAYRSSLITETVTKGLNKEVKMKDSGLEWLGMVPEHWKVMPIKYVLEQSNEGIKIGPFGSTLTGKVSTEHPVRVYGQWNIVGKDFNAGKNFVTEETYHELSSYQISANDILISMMGTVGKCAIIPETADKGIMDSHIVKIRLDKNKVLPEYFYYIYDKDCSKVIIEQIQCNKRGSIMDGLNSSLIKNFVITLPPLSEQRTITSYLGQKVGQIDTSISELEHQLSDLKSYKSSLITEAVTGKIDLRDWQTKKS